MIRNLWIVLVVLGAVALIPQPVFGQSSSCGTTLTLEEIAERHETIFVGVVIDREDVSIEDRGGLFMNTFLVEKSWKELHQETIEVRTLWDRPHYQIGERYLVMPGRDPYGYYQFACGVATPAHRAGNWFEVLGEPTWVLPPPGQRQFDTELLRPGVERPAPAGEITVRGTVRNHDRKGVPGVAVEMLGEGGVGTTTDSGKFTRQKLGPGIYLVRLTLPDGSEDERYVRVRCEKLSFAPCGGMLLWITVDYPLPAEPQVPRKPVDEPANTRPRRNQQLDSLRAVQLLEESVVSLRQSEVLRDDDQFKRALKHLFTHWGVEWEVPIELQTTRIIQAIDSLIQSGQPREGLSLANREEDRLKRHSKRLAVMRLMAEHGQWKRAITLIDSMDWQWRAVGQVLEASWPDSSSGSIKVRRVSDYLESDVPDVSHRSWQEVVDFVARQDLVSAWDIANRRLLGMPRVESLLYLLDDFENQDGAVDVEAGIVDSLLLDAYSRTEALTDAEERLEHLDWLRDICEEQGHAVCKDLAFPAPEKSPTYQASVVEHRKYGLERAFRSGDFEQARVIADSLRDHAETGERHAVTLAKGLSSVGPLCRLYAPCAEAYGVELRSRLPMLDEIASDGYGQEVDQLNALLAGLWAPIDVGRAWHAVERIEGDASRSDALGRIASAIFRSDFEMAFEALRRRGTSASTGIHLQPTYLEAKSRGDEERAHTTLSLMPTGTQRMRAKFAWAAKILRDDRRPEALQFAIDGLTEWDPSAEPMSGSRGQFNLFLHLEAYDELIAWALERPDPDDRAAALAAVVGSVSR